MADNIAISAQGWLDDQRRDPAGPVAELLRGLAGEIADAERGFVPKRTGATLASIGVEEDADDDGFIYERVVSGKLISNINASSTGYIKNRHSLNVKRRFARDDTERKAQPFQREAIDSITVIE
jgi:hypothetical protein